MKTQSTVKIKNNDDRKNIEESASKQIFSKKNIILYILFGVIGIIVTGLTIKFILNINWQNLFHSISNGFNQKIGILWFFLLVFYLIIVNLVNSFVVIIKLKKWGYKIPWYEFLFFGFTTSFFRAISPPFLSESFSVVWIKSFGVPTFRATSIMFTNAFLWQVFQLIITFPSFILILINRSLLFATTDGIAVFVLLCAGIIIDVFSMIFMFLLCVSKNVHYFLSKIFNWIKKKMHLKYHTKEEIAKKYKEKAVLKQEFYSQLKDFKTTSLVCGGLILNEIITYLAIGWSMLFVQYQHIQLGSLTSMTFYKISFDYWWAFNCANVSFTANRLNFLVPNGEGSLEYILRTFLITYSNFNISIVLKNSIVSSNVSNSTNIVKSLTDNSILIWRMFGSFVPCFIGVFTLISWIIIQTKKVKNKVNLKVSKSLN